MRIQNQVWRTPEEGLPKCSESSGISDAVLFKYRDEGIINKYIQIGNYSNGQGLTEGFSYDFNDEDEIISPLCVEEWAYVNEESEQEHNTKNTNS